VKKKEEMIVGKNSRIVRTDLISWQRWSEILGKTMKKWPRS